MRDSHVTMDTINRIVATIPLLLRAHPSPQTRKRFAAARIDIIQVDCGEALAKAMFACYQKAYTQRYRHPTAERCVYERGEFIANLYQALKAVDWWLAQCTVGTVPKSHLYQAFQTCVRLQLLEFIVRHTPEYYEARWV